MDDKKDEKISLGVKDLSDDLNFTGVEGASEESEIKTTEDLEKKLDEEAENTAKKTPEDKEKENPEEPKKESDTTEDQSKDGQGEDIQLKRVVKPKENPNQENLDNPFKEDPDTIKVKRNLRIFLCILAAVLLAIVLFFVFGAKDTENDDVAWKFDTVEYGSKNDMPVDESRSAWKILYQQPLDTYKIGTQTVRVQAKSPEDGKVKEFTHTFTIRDTKKPKITTSSDKLTVLYGENPNYDYLHIKATDPVDGAVSYRIDDTNKMGIGTHNIKIIAEDFNGNKTEKTIHVTVKGKSSESAMHAYRTAVDDLKKAYKQEQDEKAKEEAQKENASKVTSTGRIIWVGDSRYVGMENVANSSDDIYVAKGSMGYSWFVNTAIDQVNSQKKDGDTIIVNLGVNGFGASQYANKLNELVENDWKNCNVIFMSVNPIDDSKAASNGYQVRNSQVIEFNNYMMEHLSAKITYLDTYSQLINDISNETFDGVHYTSSTSGKIYTLGRNAIPD